MTTADILTRVNKAIDWTTAGDAVAIELKLLRDALEAQIRTETAKAKGCTSATTVITRMLKTAAKTETREAVHFAWLDENGRQLTCDGYRAFRLRDTLPLPVMPENVKPLDIAHLFADGIKNERIQLDLPDVAELKARIAIAKANKAQGGATWDFGKGLPEVSAAYLLDLLSVLPDAKLYADRNDPWISPLYAESDKGDALLLPVRTEAKTAERKCVQAIQKIRPTGEKSATLSLDDFAQIVDDLCA